MFRPWLAAAAALTIVLTWITYREFAADLRDAAAWGCEMSWMTPTYREIPWLDAPIKRYRLFWYREQGWDEEDKPSGIPVIFIPGNAGSYSQVRSIASSASRQYYGETRGPDELPAGARKLDFFTVDLNEEFSALHGPSLVQQAKYVAHAIRKVQGLYPNQDDVEIILIGHSMGGIVARLAARLAGTTSAVSIVLTMSTPHTIPPAPLDVTMETAYRSIASFQSNHPPPLLVSICGGISDTQVVSDACALPPHTDPDDAFTVFTSGLPGAWTAVDHQAIVWCHQIRWAVARALLEAGNGRSRQERMETLKRWLSEDPQTQAVSTTASTPRHTIQVASERMAILARQASANTPRISHCATGGACEDVKVEMTRMPWSEAEDKPFPLVGEGVKNGERAVCLDVQLQSSTGRLEVENSEIIHSGSAEGVRVVRGAEWASRDDLTPPISRALHFPDARVSALTTYRLDYSTSECIGHSPIISAHLICDGVSEKQVFAGPSRVGHLHSHISGAPFLPRTCSDLRLDITQNPACPVTRISMTLAYGPSLAKVVMRYRMAALTWGFSWLALTCARTLEDPARISLLSAYSTQIKSSWKAWVLLTGACTLQHSVSAFHSADYLLVGMPSLVSSLVIATLLVVWSLGASAMGVMLLHLICGNSLQISSTARGSTAGTMPRPPLSGAALLGAIYIFNSIWFLPHQYVGMAILPLVWRTALATTHDPYRSAIARTGAMLYTFGLPFNAAVLPVWIRFMWADWRHRFPSDHDLAWNLPPLLFLLALRYGQAPTAAMNSRKGPLKATLFALAAVTFGFGARYPVIVWAAVHAVLLAFTIALII